jgi:hypothetical protein
VTVFWARHYIGYCAERSTSIADTTGDVFLTVSVCLRYGTCFLLRCKVRITRLKYRLRIACCTVCLCSMQSLFQIQALSQPSMRLGELEIIINKLLRWLHMKHLDCKTFSAVF